MTRFWRLSQRWLPSCTICFSLLAVSVRFSRASRRYCLLMSSSCVSLSWICRWKACGAQTGASGPRPARPLPSPSRPALDLNPQAEMATESPLRPALMLKNRLSSSLHAAWHGSVSPGKAVLAAAGGLWTGGPGRGWGKPATERLAYQEHRAGGGFGLYLKPLQLFFGICVQHL